MTVTIDGYEPIQDSKTKQTDTQVERRIDDHRETDQAVASLAAVLASEPNYAPEMVEGMPLSLVESYADLALRHAHVAEIDPGLWFAKVFGLDGAWGDGDTSAAALAELREAVIGWVAVKRRFGVKIPAIDGVDLNDLPRA
jgi:predicted RNase H-like HicB family nuclease